VRIYVSGALFSEAERAWLDGLAARLRGEGFECFVPHEQFGELTELTPAEVYRVDTRGRALRERAARLARRAEHRRRHGLRDRMFAELVERDERRYRGIVGLVTDLRLERRRGNAAGDGMNLFVAGVIEACGRICWSVDEAVEALRELESQPR